MAREQRDWADCDHPGCVGSQIANATWCLAHAREKAADAFDTELRRIGVEGTVDARGVPITAELLQRILDAAPREDDRPTLTAARFDQATFQREARFDQMAFQGGAVFSRATFKGGAGFDQATFQGITVFFGATFEEWVGFDEATFHGITGFEQATFHGGARFEQVTFQGEARFDQATFRDVAWFVGATFQGEVRFEQVTFQDRAGFNRASFQDRAEFGKATFRDEVRFSEVTFQDRAEFGEATFHGETQFGGVAFQGGAGFGRATFQGRAGFEQATVERWAWFDGATFRESARFDRATFRGGAWFGGATFKGEARFEGATFQERVGFDIATFEQRAEFGGVSFEHVTRFVGAVVEGEAVFGRAIFKGEARFDGATFQGSAWFGMVIFQGWAWFGSASFKGGAGFDRATFQGRAEFGRATYVGEARFSQAAFEGEVRFDQATFRSPARWDRTTFKREVAYDGATFHNLATFNGAVFEQARQFGPLLVAWRLELNDVVFHTWVQLEVAAASLRMGRTQFVGGAQIRVRWASVVLDDASLAAPSLLASVPPFKGLDERPFTQRWARRPPDRPSAEQWRPRLLTLVRTDVAGLRIANVDLRACRFVEAHNLDKLRIEATPQLALPPAGWHLRRVGGEALPIWRWTSRMTLAEEQQWRATRRLRRTPSGRRHPQLRGWYPLACRPDPELHERSVRSPVQLAALYRELRKGREDAKDEPGAADFYYGEMEMRRHNPDTPLAERFVLWLYWLTSGYGLRGLRALICLAVIVLALAGLLHAVGFRPLHPVTPRSFWSSLLYAAESTLSLGTSDVRLTGWGRALRIVLRLTGPVLLGLALLSVRNRVKR